MLRIPRSSDIFSLNKKLEVKTVGGSYHRLAYIGARRSSVWLPELSGINTRIGGYSTLLT